MGPLLIDYHRSMLVDEVRTNAYRAAITQTVKPGDIVVDLGCGSGILSFFACEAGAAKVYALEGGPMAGVAQMMARHLGFGDRIEVIRGLSTSIELPERGNVLVTETLGSLGLDENMLGFVLDARARLLTADARFVPQRVGLHIAAVELPRDYQRHIAWWSEPHYGFDLSPLRVFASNSTLFIDLPEGAEIAAGAEVIGVDLRTFESPQVSGRGTFTAARDATVHGFTVWFEATLAEGVTVDNRRTERTSWKQTFLPLEVPIAVRRGDRIDVGLETDDGRVWTWRGEAAGEAFHQTTWLSTAPYRG